MNARIGCALVLAGIIIVSIGIVNSLFSTNEKPSGDGGARRSRPRNPDGAGARRNLIRIGLQLSLGSEDEADQPATA